MNAEPVVTAAVASSPPARPAEAAAASSREARTQQPRPQQLQRGAAATVTISDDAAAGVEEPPAPGAATPPVPQRSPRSPQQPPPSILRSPTAAAGKRQPASQAKSWKSGALQGTMDSTPPSTTGPAAVDKSPACGTKVRLPQSSPRSSPRNTRPPVPAFSALASQAAPRPRRESEPWLKLREIKLPPPKPEDNYELSDKGEESDAEEPDRSHKHVPRWSSQYLELIEKQADIDPDTIFGRRVPRCDLLVIFSDNLYQGCNKERPKRKRGSSGEWRQDRLTTQEVGEYKKKMGHAKSWMANAENLDSNRRLQAAAKN